MKRYVSGSRLAVAVTSQDIVAVALHLSLPGACVRMLAYDANQPKTRHLSIHNRELSLQSLPITYCRVDAGTRQPPQDC